LEGDFDHTDLLKLLFSLSQQMGAVTAGVCTSLLWYMTLCPTSIQITLETA